MITPVQNSLDKPTSPSIPPSSYENAQKVHEAALARFKTGTGVVMAGVLLNATGVFIEFANVPDSARIAIFSTAWVMLIAGFGLICHAQAVLNRKPSTTI